MASPSYIYPAWLRAKRELIESLQATGKGLSPAQTQLILEWFRSYVFEVGASFSTSVEMLAVTKDIDGYKKHVREKLLHQIAAEMHKNGFFTENSLREGRFPVERTELRVVVFGAPILTGPGTREKDLANAQRNNND